MFYEVGDHGLPHDPFKALVVPRPIGWISTFAADGTANLAPFSFFNAAASAPPVVLFACNGRHAEGGEKDSLINAEASGAFVANVATWELRAQVNATSAAVGRAVDEFHHAGLTAVPARLVAAPRVAESPVNMECRHLQTVRLPSDDPEATNAIVLGRVVGVHIDDSLVVDGRISVERLRPIARLGYDEYAVVEAAFRMPRPG